MLIKENKVSFQFFAAARLIDTHAHLNFNAFENDADEVVRRSLDNNVWMVNVGSQYSTSQRAVEMAEEYPEGVYASIGLHPIYASEQSEGLRREHSSLCTKDGFSRDKYQKLALSKKVVAIGEIGLDYKAEYISFKEKQKEVFLEQLNLAKELNLPVILHCRMAHDEVLNILSDKNYKEVKGTVHCFTGTWQQAEKYLAMGFYLGFNGIIFKFNSEEIIKKTPSDRILVETDCPYLTPFPETGRNEPLYVKHVVEKIAGIKGLAKRTSFSSSPSFLRSKNSVFEEIAKITTENAKRLFKI
ncbi:MAG: TatD family hydrolase [Candidatus Nealsonbacteria bacterium]|nr:TatD family hydrolase [Candidatus Nealsonbacteria bacterium]